MAYYHPKKSPPPEEESVKKNDQSGVNARDIIDETITTIRAPFAGFWQGFTGRNKSFEQWKKERKRRQRGLPVYRPNWLQRLMAK